MPLLSREVLTLRLVFDCDDEHAEEYEVGEDIEDVGEELGQDKPQRKSRLLALPVELRLEILRHLLCLECNRKAHTRRPPQSSISELLYLNPRRILEAAPFKHKGNQDINGSPPILKSCHLHMAVLKTCKQLYQEGKTVLYGDNKVLAIQSSIKGLGAKFQNYGVPVLGPLPASRLISGPRDDAHPTHFRFDPLVLFTGGTTKQDAPFYVSSHMDAADFVHALWLLVKSPFARGMGFNVTLSTGLRLHPRHMYRTDSFVRLVVLSCLYTNINYIKVHYPHSNTTDHIKAVISGREDPPQLSEISSENLKSLRVALTKHLQASEKEPSLYLYRVICDYLERILLQGEHCIERGQFISGELSFERVCYEACSLVRTRTSALVDVSSKSRDGINRVCKLIAVSAYRLCELRSGSLAQLILKRRQRDHHLVLAEVSRLRGLHKDKENTIHPPLTPCANDSVPDTPKEEDVEKSETSLAESREDGSSDTADDKTGSGIAETSPKVIAEISTGPEQKKSPVAPTTFESLKSTVLPRTSRLEPPLARDLALTSGLLALRLPCAAPVPEWNMRLDTMLLRLFAWRNDVSNAVWCIRRIHNNGTVVMNGVKQRNRTGEKKWEPLTVLLEDLEQQLKPGAAKTCFLETADKVEQVMISLWGERLIPKKGFNGLIWTFRWAG